MYWPDELPAGTQDGKRLVEGRQPYHGINELIASNHSGSRLHTLQMRRPRLTIPTVDVINVVSVTASAIVNQWDEQDEDSVQPALYWRQAIDVRTMELSVCSRLQDP
jgi:hypothetical protein